MHFVRINTWARQCQAAYSLIFLYQEDESAGCHVTTQLHFSLSVSLHWKRSVSESLCLSVILPCVFFLAISQFWWSSRPNFLRACILFWLSFHQVPWPFLLPVVPAYWVLSDLMPLKLMLVIVCLGIFDSFFDWHGSWAVDDRHDIWQLGGHLCSTPLQNHLDSLGVGRHQYM